jgi:hypothetical protein
MLGEGTSYDASWPHLPSFSQRVTLTGDAITDLHAVEETEGADPNGRRSEGSSKSCRSEIGATESLAGG